MCHGVKIPEKWRNEISKTANSAVADQPPDPSQVAPCDRFWPLLATYRCLWREGHKEQSGRLLQYQT
jgi:hypothetical protein